MNKLLVVSLAALVALVSTAPAQAAGVVQVRFVEPQNFTDVRDGSYLLDQNLRSLERVVIHAAAPHVADGQTLTIDITDVDLAGYIHPGAMPRAVRVLRGGADWPRITLRWRLEGAAPRSGEAVVQDLDYQSRFAPAQGATGLTYEKRMLQDYFRSQFDGGAAAH